MGIHYIGEFKYKLFYFPSGEPGVQVFPDKTIVYLKIWIYQSTTTSTKRSYSPAKWVQTLSRSSM